MVGGGRYSFIIVNLYWCLITGGQLSLCLGLGFVCYSWTRLDLSWFGVCYWLVLALEWSNYNIYDMMWSLSHTMTPHHSWKWSSWFVLGMFKAIMMILVAGGGGWKALASLYVSYSLPSFSLQHWSADRILHQTWVTPGALQCTHTHPIHAHHAFVCLSCFFPDHSIYIFSLTIYWLQIF